jgi:hypothetical protein
VPDWDSTERSNSDEDATWRDLVARFDSPVATQEPAPWPDRENTPGPESSEVPGVSAGASEASSGSGPESAVAGPGPADVAGPPPIIVPAVPFRQHIPVEHEEHFIPEPPPPLPKLDSLAKASWLALFGGPGYLLLATVLGWSIPGIAVFCAVAAFVAGVALLVFRLTDSDRDDDDHGAVI